MLQIFLLKTDIRHYEKLNRSIGHKSARVLQGGNKGACFDRVTPYIELHNKQLSKLLQNLQSYLKGFKYSLLDLHTLLEEMINHPSKYGMSISIFSTS